VFAATALLLASIGVYGVLAYIVAQHTRDIGIRMALGATQARIIADVLRQGMRLTLIGVGIGVAGALVASRLMATLLYGVSATDAITFCAVPVVLLGVALLASYLASRRATQVDPMIALRYE
jgi:ABC-type antimicrobial peptide transport system permease subunit